MKVLQDLFAAARRLSCHDMMFGRSEESAARRKAALEIIDQKISEQGGSSLEEMGDIQLSSVMTPEIERLLEQLTEMMREEVEGEISRRCGSS